MGLVSDSWRSSADVEEGRRAGAAVHVLVRAPHGDVGPGRREGDRHGAHRVRQVPEGQRACPVRERGDGGHVVHEGRPVRRVREGDEGGVSVDRARERLLGDREPVLGLHHHQPVSLAEQVDRALQHVEVRGKVHLVGDDGSPIGPGPQRRHRELEQVHRRGVRHHDVGRGGADQRGQLRADPLAGGEPSLTPPANESPAPLAVDRLPEARPGLSGQPAERVPVEVDEARVADDELPPEPREWIRRVETAGLGQRAGVGRRRQRRPARRSGGRRGRRMPEPAPRRGRAAPPGRRVDPRRVVSRDADPRRRRRGGRRSGGDMALLSRGPRTRHPRPSDRAAAPDPRAAAGSGPTRTSFFPKFRPCMRSSSAPGARSSPSTMSSRYLSRPSRTHSVAGPALPCTGPRSRRRGSPGSGRG